MAIVTKITKEHGWGGTRGVTAFFLQDLDLRPRYIKLGSLPQIEINWNSTPQGKLYTLNKMSTNDELLWKIPAGTSLPTTLSIFAYNGAFEAQFINLHLEGGTISTDDVLLINKIELSFNVEE